MQQHALPLFHIHIPKNAGTSLVSYLRRLDGPGNTVELYRERQKADLLTAELQDEVGGQRHYTTHLPLKDIHAAMSPAARRQFRWISFVRCPFEREPSLFRYAVRQGFVSPPAAGQWDRAFAAFLHRPDGRNRQCTHFSAAGTADAALEVAAREGVEVLELGRLGAWIDAVYAGRGLPTLPPIVLNRTRAAAPLSPTALGIIEDHCAEDIRLHRAILTPAADPTPALDRTPVAVIGDDGALRSVVGRAGGRFSLFGGGPAGRSLLQRCRRAGLVPAAILNSRSRGQVDGTPLVRLDDPAALSLRGLPVLLAAEAFGPVWRTLRAHGFTDIHDALDLATRSLPVGA